VTARRREHRLVADPQRDGVGGAARDAELLGEREEALAGAQHGHGARQHAEPRLRQELVHAPWEELPWHVEERGVTSTSSP
jgi:hypothetical protein